MNPTQFSSKFEYVSLYEEPNQTVPKKFREPIAEEIALRYPCETTGSFAASQAARPPAISTRFVIPY